MRNAKKRVSRADRNESRTALGAGVTAAILFAEHLSEVDIVGVRLLNFVTVKNYMRSSAPLESSRQCCTSPCTPLSAVCPCNSLHSPKLQMLTL